MYKPYDNSSNNNHNPNDDRTGKENSAGYGTAETPSYTTQASQNTPQGQHIGGMGVPVGSPYTRKDGTASSPSYPTSNSQQTYQTGAGSSVPGVPQSQQARPSYTWNTNGGAPQQTAPYYVPEPPKKKAKGHGGKVFAKILAGVLCCAVVSLSSVGMFALMIQNGVINVESTGDSKTAAFTLYKLEDGNKASNMAVNGEALTPQQVAEKLIPVSPDDLVIVNPNVEHTEVSLNASPLEYIVLGVEGMEFAAERDPASSFPRMAILLRTSMWWTVPPA